MAKPIGFTISILKDTNRVVASSEIDFTKVKIGDYFRIDKDPMFYTIGRIDKIFYIKDFTVLDRKTIEISSPVSINLLHNDTLKITYKEYTCAGLLEIKNPGIRYRVGDVLTVKGGTASVNPESGVIESTSFTVVGVDDNGCILSLGPRTKGKYIEAPKEDVVSLVGGAGSSAVAELHWELLEHRATLENTISHIPDINRGIIGLTFPLPENLLNGKFSVEKWQLALTSNYVGEDRLNASYNIVSDFTPHLRLPLMLQNSYQKELLHNQSMQLLEERIMLLERKIAELSR